MGNRFIGFVIAIVLAGVLCGGMLLVAGGKIQDAKSSYPEGVITRLPSKGEWIRPQRSPQGLYENFSVEELIDRWDRWPEKGGMESYQSLYAQALAIYAEEAEPAVPHLAPAVKHFEPNLRRQVMNVLAAIGDEGLPPLMEALDFWPPGDDPRHIASDIRRDAAEALAKAASRGWDISESTPVMESLLLNSAVDVFTRQHAASALSNTPTDEATEALEAARDFLYDQDGLSMQENRILRIVNIGLKRKQSG